MRTVRHTLVSGLNKRLAWLWRFDYNHPAREGIFASGKGGRLVMLNVRSALFVCALSWFGCACFASAAHAYDLSRQDPSPTEKTERGFINLQGWLWTPAFGSFSGNHQLSVDLGGEVGFRVLSLRDHNLYVVGGLTFSPQKLKLAPPDNSTSLLLGYGGVRYIPGMLCTSDGVGCLFAELRLALAFESAEDSSGHSGPHGEWTLLPGVGYRLRLGGVFQLGARADIAYTSDGYRRQFGWIEVGGFAGFGW